jgi:DNA-binding LacI/PurR family transcriptional regulator
MVRRPTIADVARHAGVSKGTVSFALNGRPGVAEETKARIFAAMRELGWQPDRQARSLRASRAYALGLVVARPPELLGIDPFFPTFIAGLESVLGQAGQALVLQVVPDAAAEAEGYRRLARDRRADGVVLTDVRHDDPRLTLVAELGLHAVTLNRPDTPSTEAPAVCLDDRPGVAAAVEHLIGLGHTRIAHVAGDELYVHGSSRRAAYAETMAAAGLEPGPVAVGDFTAAAGAAATERLLADGQRPTAIVYANDSMAIAGAATAHERGLELPRDLSIVGYDDAPLAAHVHPPLTTVRADPFRWGAVTAELLLAKVEGVPVSDVELAPGELIVRGSTAPPPTDPEPRELP